MNAALLSALCLVVAALGVVGEITVDDSDLTFMTQLLDQIRYVPKAEQCALFWEGLSERKQATKRRENDQRPVTDRVDLGFLKEFNESLGKFKLASLEYKQQVKSVQMVGYIRDCIEQLGKLRDHPLEQGTSHQGPRCEDLLSENRRLKERILTLERERDECEKKQMWSTLSNELAMGAKKEAGIKA